MLLIGRSGIWCGCCRRSQAVRINVATHVGITVRYLEILEARTKNVRWENG